MSAIRLLLADVDGTLVTPQKQLTDAAIAAVGELRDAGILFAITSGRPPRGMSMLIEPLDLQTPIAAFNGGVVVDREMSVIEQHTIPAELVAPASELLESLSLDVWLYQGSDWYVRDPKAPHVDREAQTVQFPPTVRTSYDGLTDGIAKIVGVSDDHDAIERASQAARERFGDHVSAALSQPYYLDITHPDANKGSVVRYLARRYSTRERADRDHRRHAQRRADVRPLRPQHRDGQRQRRGSTRRAARDQLQRAGGVRERGAAVCSAGELSCATSSSCDG